MTKVFLVIYENEEFDGIFGIKQLKEFTQYRIDNFGDYVDVKELYKDYNNLTEEECLNILETDGYTVKVKEVE